MVVCTRCGKHLTRPESIIRGMGPICYGKNYTYRALLKEGYTRDEILEIPKEEIMEMAKEALKLYRNKQLKKKRRKPRGGYIRLRKVKSIKDKNQLTLDIYLDCEEVIE